MARTKKKLDRTPKEEPLARGRRLRMLRALAGKTQRELAKICGVSGISMNLWENGTYNGITHKAANKIIQALTTENIECSIGWLWTGIGAPPIRKANLAQNKETLPKGKEARTLRHELDALKKEIDLFQESFPDSVIHEISDNSMLGYAEKEYVGGLWLEEPPKDNPDEPFIILLDNDKILLRYIGYDTEKEQFFLHANQVKSGAPDLYVMDAKIKKCARIVRRWRR